MRIFLETPAMLKTALYMRSRGYSERSVREITGLSEREVARCCVLDALKSARKLKGRRRCPVL